MKKIIICADGTWNRPERNLKKDFPTNVLKFARGLSQNDGTNKQIIFYDWGIGSYHDKFAGGALGVGLDKNIKDCYRFLVHNYEKGDKIYLFGFSRGAYTVRSLCGLINNCSILKSSNANYIESAFELYKTKKHKPNSSKSKIYREKYAIQDKTMIEFVGVWDTVGAMGLPFSLFGLIEKKHLFYDQKLGSNIVTARHAISLDEQREDFSPTIWKPRSNVDLKQVWFAGVHSDIGGGYKPERDKTILSDIPLIWMQKEAIISGLVFEPHLMNVKLNPLARKHNEYKSYYLALGKKQRVIPDPNVIPTFIHISVKQRYEKSTYRSNTLDNYIKKFGRWPQIEE
ncbi:MAG: DUF2235 domain-containing protein [Bacteroidales bacterium]|jgi:uncharacterized protein (DUF2235 family)|nr:DUF2235 domain-containing protein [Bacteroidales bacterium]